MINEELIDKDKLIDVQRKKISQLTRTINEFKKYDEDRKKYYKNALIELGELKSLLDELIDSDENDRIKKIKQQKNQLRVQQAALKLSKLPLEELDNLTADKAYIIIENNILKKSVKRYKDLYSIAISRCYENNKTKEI